LGENLKTSKFHKVSSDFFAQAKDFFSSENIEKITLLSSIFFLKPKDYRSRKNRVKSWLTLRTIFAQARKFSLKRK